jgi:NAD kinase
LVATRTGSTAYNRTLGGPILIKEKNFVFKVMGPTEVDDRNAWIISEKDRVKFTGFQGSPARLVCDDKEIVILRQGDIVEIGKSGTLTRFVKFSSVDW